MHARASRRGEGVKGCARACTCVLRARVCDKSEMHKETETQQRIPSLGRDREGKEREERDRQSDIQQLAIRLRCERPVNRAKQKLTESPRQELKRKGDNHHDRS